MLTFEDIDMSTKEGQYLVAAVNILFRRRNSSDFHFNQTMEQIKEELDRLKIENPKHYPALKANCVGCGLGIDEDNPVGLCNSCQWGALSDHAC